MSTSLSATPTAPWPPSTDAPAEATAPFGGPGVLRIDPRVVQKLAARAADEVDGVSRARVAPLTRAIHHPVPASTPPHQLPVDLDLSVCVQYPRSLRTAVEELAAHVSRRVEQLAGRPVGGVNVRVTGLGGTGDAIPRRVR